MFDDNDDGGDARSEAREILKDKRFRMTLSNNLIDGEASNEAIDISLVKCFPNRPYGDVEDDFYHELVTAVSRILIDEGAK